jgi:hypothetical protein
MIPVSYLQFDAHLVEEAVLLRISRHAGEPFFRRMRNRIYEIENPEEREDRFRRFHGDWFLRLQLGHPLETALAEQPELRKKTRLCAVVTAITRQDEGADLHGVTRQPDAADALPPVIVIKLRPNALMDETGVLPFLRHELMHIADMLDPAFGYEPLLPRSALGPSHENLIRERYKVLWDTWISGRLQRRGWAGPAIRQTRWDQFAKAFSFLGATAEAKFAGVYESGAQTHRAFVELATTAAVSENESGKPQARFCPLCRFPTYNLNSAADLAATVLDEIAADHPGWQPHQGLCDQCAELYRTRDISRSAETVLPCHDTMPRRAPPTM